ncbi:ATP-binding cassette domain-containing protein [Paenibacillus chartarius]|uniref:ATP-binding cassette domain-containing protein n=1 Tax=Paenibacillus chartarius TaxID=747481 RepID=A0ABV6DG68_9BACL
MISVTNISKTFRVPVAAEGRFGALRSLWSGARLEKTAVRDVSFTIERGEFVGYIGPNGAGKSTTIKMLTGILHPTSGSVRIAGFSPHRQRTEVARRLGVVFGQRTQLWWDLPVKDSYDILAAMYKVPGEDKRRRLEELTELLGLDEFMQTPVRKLSLGQRMRADLAAALLHAPDVLFLDEPTIGLDVLAKRSIRSFLQKLNRELGVTILLTTHDMDDIEQLCSRVMVINRGELAYDGSIAALRERIGLPTVIRVTFEGAGSGSVSSGGDVGVSGVGAGGNGGIVGVGESVGSSTGVEAGGSVGAGGASGGWSVPERWEGAFRLTGRTDSGVTLECNRTTISVMDMLKTVGTWGPIADVHMEEPDFEDIIHRIY